MIYEMGICSKCHQEKKIKDKKANLCSTCYNKTREVVGICSECKKEKIIKSKKENLCSACYSRKLRSRPGYVKPQRIGICTSCHRERPLVTKTDLCNSCHVREYRRRTGYKGPVRACIVCGEFTNIHSNDMCRSCYNKKYAEEHHDEILANKRRNKKLNPEKFRKWGRNWYSRNRELVNERRRVRYWQNPEKARAAKRLYYIKNKDAILAEVRRIHIQEAIKHNVTPDELLQIKKLDEYKTNIPELKLQWVNDFLETVYADRAYKTKLQFLRDLDRLLIHLKEHNVNAYWGGWNMLSLVDIENCQVDTGLLKDSLRVFFRWLKKRKFIVEDLQNAIPTNTRKWQFSEVTIESLSEIAKRFYNGNMKLETRLAGLLIIFFLLTNEQLRSIEISHFKDRKIFVNGVWHDVDTKLWGIIEGYKKWRENFYLGYAPKYFFVTGRSVGTQKRVSSAYFSGLFEQEKVGVSPSKLRKAMIFFHKNKTGMDSFALGAIAGIQPRSATRY